MTDLERAINLLGEDHACVAVGGDVVYTSDERGIKPLLLWLDQNNAFFSGMAIADRVIGRAAAFLMVFGGAKTVYGRIVSDGALRVFAEHGLTCSCGEQVPYIINRAGDGMCPMEAHAQHLHTPDEAFAFFRRLILKKD